MSDEARQNEQIIFCVWRGRVTVVRCAGMGRLEEDEIRRVQDALEQFAVDCHHEFVYYSGVQSSLGAIRSRLLGGARYEDLVVAISQGPGEKPLAVHTRITWGEAADSFSEAERSWRIPSRSFVVLVYALWDSVARPQIARALGVKVNDVKADIMGDWGRLRHWLLYQSKKSEEDYFRGASELARALGSRRGVPEVTPEGVMLLVKCLDSLEVRVDPKGQGFYIQPAELDPEALAEMKRKQGDGQVIPILPRRPY